jgi:uncharacterized membrane protein
MTEAAAAKRWGPLPEPVVQRLRAFAASTDNVGSFFGEDIFVAVGSILLITGFVDATYDLKLEALEIALWAIPTALCAFAIHGLRMLRFDRQLDAMARRRRPVRSGTREGRGA